MVLGLEKAGFEIKLVIDADINCCRTLKRNRPKWNVLKQDVSKMDFKKYKGLIDIVSGGFPCQSFSIIGKQGGFEDVRGTLFFEFIRAVKEINPLVFIAENTDNILKHDNGDTFKTIKNVIKEIGYDILSFQILNAFNYKVPQNRKRLFLIAIRRDLNKDIKYKSPLPYHKKFVLKDALKKGSLYKTDCSESKHYNYSTKKIDVLKLVPEGGNWRSLPKKLQLEYMGKDFFGKGGKSSIAKRLSWNHPSPTLLTLPDQKRTERCHPDFNRPLSITESARIQTFPDDWVFAGSTSSCYRQIGNAVPVNLAYFVGLSVINLLDDITKAN